jgi:hypothetical protein
MSFWRLQFAQKNELENSIFCPSLLGQKFFVLSLGELKKTKCPFEINRPLVSELLAKEIFCSTGRKTMLPKSCCCQIMSD